MPVTRRGEWVRFGVAVVIAGLAVVDVAAAVAGAGGLVHTVSWVLVAVSGLLLGHLLARANHRARNPGR